MTGTYRPRTRLLCGFIVVAAFVTGTWLLFQPLGLADPSHLPGCACGDQALQLWFLAADRYAIVHHQLPLQSARLDYPVGVNFMDNTSMPLLGVLATQLISAVGPVGAYVFLLRLAFVASATSCYVVLGRYVSLISAAVGGALYGFSPYMVHHGADHLSLVFVPIPPIVFFLVERQRRARDDRRRVCLGAIAGLLLVVQYSMSSEIFVTTTVLAVLTGIVMGAARFASNRTIALASVRSSLLAPGAAAAVILVFLSYPAWYSIAGPDHVVGPTQSASSSGIDLLNIVWPATHQVVFASLTGRAGAALPLQGATAFVGLPLLAIISWVVVAGRHRGEVRCAAALGVAAWVLALGPRLVVDGHRTSIPLPFAFVTHIPLLQDIVPVRLVLYLYLAAATLLAVGVDMAITGTHGVGGAHWQVRSIAATAVAVMGLVLVLPTGSYRDETTGVARVFLDGRATAVIPTNGVALAYPYPSFPASNAMIWQADANLRFSLLGGYALRPLGDGHATRQPALLAPHAVLDFLLTSDGTKAVPGLKRVPPAAAARVLPGFVARYGVTTLLVDGSTRGAHAVASLFSSVYGAPQRFGELDVWGGLSEYRDRHNDEPWNSRRSGFRFDRFRS